MEDEEQIAQETIYTLIVLGAIFAASIVYSLSNLLKRHDRNGAALTNISRTSTEAVDQAPPKKESDVKPTQKPGVSLKQLVKQSQQAVSRQAAPDKPVEHALYLNYLKGVQGNVVGLSVSSNGCVATVSSTQILKVFDVHDLAAKSFPSHRAALSRAPVDVAFGGPSEIFVLTEGPLGNAMLELFSFQQGKLSQEWEVSGIHGREAGKGLSAAVNLQGQSLVLSYSALTDVQIYTSKGKQLASVNTSGLKNHSAVLSRQARFFGAATFTSDVKIHEIQFARDGELRRVQKVMDLKYAHNGQVFCMDFSSDGSKAVTASKDGTFVVWNLDVEYSKDQDVKILIQKTQETGGARYSHLACGPHGLVAAAFGKSLHFLDSHNGALLEEIEEAHDADIISLQWSPIPLTMTKSKIGVLLTSGLDKRVRMWRAPIT